MWSSPRRNVIPRTAPWLVAAVRHRSAYAPPRRQMHQPVGSRSEKFVWQTHTADDVERYDIDTREAHALLGTEPNDTLMRIKLNYLLRCRMFHPDAGGNAGMFYKITLAYERILFDRGVESRHGKISFSDVLGPRAKFDETPLIPEDVTEEEAAKLLTERDDEGNEVAWAKLAGEWTDVQTAEELKVIEAKRAADERAAQDDDEEEEKLSAWEKDARLTVRQQQGYAYGVETAGTMLKRKRDNEKEAREAAEVQAVLEKNKNLSEAKAELTPSESTDIATVKEAGTTAVTRTDEVTEVDAATFPDDGMVVISPPKKALFNQTPLSKWSDDQLMRRWSTAAERLTHDEEESTARVIIERAINETGGALTKSQKEFMMTHLVERSDSVAGEAARAATEIMHNTIEKKQAVKEAILLGMLIGTTIFGIIIVGMKWMHHQINMKKQKGLEEHLNMETMLPWWGNDREYEGQVKRLFIEEWKRARMAARRQQTFQDGVNRETMTFDERRGLETSIFEVTSDHLRAMREKAERRRTPTDLVSQDVFDGRIRGDGVPDEPADPGQQEAAPAPGDGAVADA